MEEQTREPPDSGGRPGRALRSERGSHLVTLVIVFAVLAGLAALAIDIPYIRMASVEAQYAADAGAHAALVELKRGASLDEARATAERVVAMNEVAGMSGPLQIESVDFGGWSFTDRRFDTNAGFVNAVRVQVATRIDLVLAPLFSKEFSFAHPVGHSVAALRTREIVVVQDITGTFKEEIGLAREADLVLLDYVHTRHFPGDEMAMVTFVGDAEVFTPMLPVDTEYPNIRSKWETLTWCQKTEEECLAARIPYDPTREHMQECRSGGDGTNQGAGIDLAVDLFEARGDKDALWVIVLISDGKAQCIPSTTGCDATRFANGRRAAAEAWADHQVNLFTVSYNERHDPVQTGYLEDLVTGFGEFYETPDPTDLPIILAEIAATIPIAIVE